MIHLISIFQKCCYKNTEQFGKRKPKSLQTGFPLDDYAKTHHITNRTALKKKNKKTNLRIAANQIKK